MNYQKSLIKNVNFVPGEYLVDVEVNGEKVGSGFITVTDSEKQALCLANEWLSEQGVFYQGGLLCTGIRRNPKVLCIKQ